MNYLLNDNINLDTIFKSLTAGDTKSDTTNYKSDNKDFNDLYQPLGTYSNLKYWTNTNYKVSSSDSTGSTDLKDIFEFNLIKDTDSTTYRTFPINDGVLIYIDSISDTYMTFNSTNKFNVDVIVCAGGGGGGGAANEGNAGGGGGGGGLAHFKLTQPDTSFDTIEFAIGRGGKYATGNDSDHYATSGVNTTFDMYQGSTEDGNKLLSCNVSGGGGGGNGKGNGKNGGAGGGAGSYSSGSTSAGSGTEPTITYNSDIGYSNIQNNKATSGGKGQDDNNDNGGGGGGGGALTNGVVGGANYSSDPPTKGAGGDGYTYAVPVYNSDASLNLYLSYGGGGGASYSSQPATATDRAGRGGYGTPGKQKGTAASNAITIDGLFTNIYAGSGGGGNGNDGKDTVYGNGNGANGIIVLIFTNK